MEPSLSTLLELNVNERLKLVEDLWDSIASSPESLPVADWHKKELDRREAAHSQNPEPALPWEDAKERIREHDG
jgi:putative addiction module component (TIGR02574 family)